MEMDGGPSPVNQAGSRQVSVCFIDEKDPPDKDPEGDPSDLKKLPQVPPDKDPEGDHSDQKELPQANKNINMLPKDPPDKDPGGDHSDQKKLPQDPPDKEPEGDPSEQKNLPQGTLQKISWRLVKTFQKNRVGIFSRSAESDYQWLKTKLNEHFSDLIKEIRPFKISNNGRSQFQEEVSKCQVGILYHTKTRGRINVTNVPGSLYDEELEYMSAKLGKGNVIVIVDDLSDSEYKDKERLLRIQPSIGRFAKDLILVRANRKEFDHLECEKIKDSLLYQWYYYFWKQS